MPAWLLRGLCMGLLHAIAVTAVAQLAVFQPTGVDTAKAVSIALLVGAAALWSAIDGWLARADRGRNWFVAALVAGPVAGILGVIGRSLFVDQTGINALDAALTGGAAFTALLVLVPAGLGLFVGGRVLATRHDRRRAPGNDDNDRRARDTARSGAAHRTSPRPHPGPRPRSRN